jgi:CheY-like chemotaxis protein
MQRFKRILLAEDSKDDVELTLAALEEFDLAADVAVVADGVGALDYLYYRGNYTNRPHGLPSVMVLDLKMPKVGGAEVLRQVKSDPNLKRIPVVILTSSKEDRDLAECYDLGANSYIVKSVEYQRFVESVKKLSCYWTFFNEPPPPADSHRI